MFARPKLHPKISRRKIVLPGRHLRDTLSSTNSDHTFCRETFRARLRMLCNLIVGNSCDIRTLDLCSLSDKTRPEERQEYDYHRFKR
jgi:hypothetical protein